MRGNGKLLGWLRVLRSGVRALTPPAWRPHAAAMRAVRAATAGESLVCSGPFKGMHYVSASVGSAWGIPSCLEHMNLSCILSSKSCAGGDL